MDKTVEELMQLWPIASTSSFTVMPLAGLFFLLLGWGLAETRAHEARHAAATGAR